MWDGTASAWLRIVRGVSPPAPGYEMCWFWNLPSKDAAWNWSTVGSLRALIIDIRASFSCDVLMSLPLDE